MTPLSPPAQLALIAVVGVTVGDLMTRTHERIAADGLTPEAYEAALTELEAAGLIKHYIARTPGEDTGEPVSLPGPEAFPAVFDLLHADIERLAAQEGVPT